jgi:GNAT superfamily N-acetyltransferase
MLEIRKANLQDAETVQQLAETTWWPVYEPIVGAGQVRYMLDAFYSIPVLQQQISSGSQTYILLTEDGTPKGFAAFSPRTEDPEIYKLHKLYCLPAEQGKGYGKMLIDAVEKAVTDNGRTILELNVNRYNKARTFYERMGYDVVYEEDIMIGNGYEMNDFVMRKVLNRDTLD